MNCKLSLGVLVAVAITLGACGTSSTEVVVQQTSPPTPTHSNPLPANTGGDSEPGGANVPTTATETRPVGQRVELNAVTPTQRNPYDYRVDLVRKLASTHEAMVIDGLPLLRVLVSDVKTNRVGGDSVAFTLEASDELWKPEPAGVQMTPTSWTLELEKPGRAVLDFFDGIPPGSEAIAVVSGADLLALAVFDGSGDPIEPSVPVGPIFLGAAIAELQSTPEPYFAAPVSCAGDQEIPSGAGGTPVDALLRYLEFHGSVPALGSLDAASDAWALADQLESRFPVRIDAVSGLPVSPSINDLYLQLVEGTSAEDIQPAAVINAVIDMQGFPESRYGEVLVIFELESGRQLGWFELSEVGQTDSEGSDIPARYVIVEILKPEPDQSVALSVQPKGYSVPRLGCPIQLDTTVNVPYDSVAGGESRIAIAPADLAYETIGAAWFDNLTD